MEWMSRADVILLLVAAYVAVMTLVRMMQGRHQELVADVKRQVEAHRKRPRKRPKTSDGKANDQNRDAA